MADKVKVSDIVTSAVLLLLSLLAFILTLIYWMFDDFTGASDAGGPVYISFGISSFLFLAFIYSLFEFVKELKKRILISGVLLILLLGYCWVFGLDKYAVYARGVALRLWLLGDANIVSMYNGNRGGDDRFYWISLRRKGFVRSEVMKNGGGRAYICESKTTNTCLLYDNKHLKESELMAPFDGWHLIYKCKLRDHWYMVIYLWRGNET